MATPLYGNPNPAIGQDPAYLAFQAAIGLENSLGDADVVGRTGRLQLAERRGLEDLAYAGGLQREGIRNSYEARGGAGSGFELRDISRQRRNEASRSAEMQATTADQIANLQMGNQRDQARRATDLAGRAPASMYDRLFKDLA